ncbi:sugar porter family MFS transporter [Sphingobium sp. CAP-1]|nr:sugar porter family MFS transporter [Sphingobium sp. CAP-1]
MIRQSGDLPVRFAASAGLAGLLFGFDTAVISGATDSLRTAFALSPTGLGLAVSAALWGTLVGATCAGGPGDRWGSRTLLIWIAAAYLLSALASALAPDFWSFALARFIGGLAIGGSSVLAPVYISEISPARRRGFLVGLFQFNIVAGILLAYLSNFLIAAMLPEAVAWRWKLAAAALPSLLFLILMLDLPDSPHWLANHGHLVRARLAAARLKIEAGDWMETGQQEAGARLSWRHHARPILLALAIATFNQLSGINAILYYINDIFAAAGFSHFSADMQAVAIGIANLCATLFAMTIIDSVGRRPLLLTGAAGTCLALSGVTAIYATGAGAGLLLPLLILFIVSFAISQGAVIWVYLSEIFPTPVRARGQALGSATHWILNAIISFAFPVIAARSHALPFAVFALAMAAQMLVVWFCFPETRGVALEEIDLDGHRTATQPAH